jgi:S-formylglutathione hydrolase FrmB
MLTGFSMGGFGAFHYLLAAPGQFIALSSLSGWFESWVSLSRHIRPTIERLLGPYAKNQKQYAAHDTTTRVKAQAAAGILFPPLYLTCGTEDHLLGQNRAMHALLTELGIAHEYHETPGAHDWPFWRDASPGIIDFHWRALTS